MNTGPFSYPVSARLNGFSPSNAVSLTPATGTIGGTSPLSLTMTADAAVLQRPGTYTGTAQFEVVVKGITFRKEVPITVNWEAQRLVTMYDGIALSSFPSASRELLSRTLTVSHSHWRTGVPWQAVASHPWLQLSRDNGETGDALTITAQPETLAPDQLHNATVTLTSSDPRLRGQTIRVALWKDSNDPVDRTIPLTDGSPADVITNPVEPWAYVLGRNGTIRVFNVYSGAQIDQYASGASSLGRGTISSDGTVLFVTDRANIRTIVIDALQGSHITTLDSNNEDVAVDLEWGPAFARLNGHPVLWTAFNTLRTREAPVDVETWQRLSAYNVNGSLVSTHYGDSHLASPDGRYFYTRSSSSIEVDFVRFSALGGNARLQLDPGEQGAYYHPSISTLWDACVTPENVVYALHGPVMGVKNYNFMQHLGSIDLPPPLGNDGYVMRCTWDNRIYVGRAAGGSDMNVLVYDGSAALGTFAIPPFRHGPAGASFQPYSLELSGDARRIVWPGSDATTTVLAISSLP
jgi:hypothetical protein